jgi:thiamine kinase-like enzyme
MYAEKVIRDLEIWPETPRVTPISQGYTNQNFFIDVAGKSYFGRVSTDVPRHGISRIDEAVCVRLAADAGLAPAVTYARNGIVITRAVNGQPLQADEMAATTLHRIARLLAKVHDIGLPRDIRSFDPIRACRRYLDQLRTHRVVVQNRRRFETILAAAPQLESDCLIHGDAFYENFIDDGQRLWLIDWEYAGRGDPAVDLAFVAMNFDLNVAQVRFLAASHGGDIPAAKVLVLMPVAALRDVLWCLAETEANSNTEVLAGYARKCLSRLGIS